MYKDLIKINENHQEIAGIKIADIAKKFSTPTICYNQEIIEDNLVMLKNSFVSDKFECEVIYASKAFSIKAMYQLLSKYQIGADVVSGGELYTAIKAGFDLTKVYFHGNNKSEEELILAIKHDIGCIVIDNLNEIELLNRILKSLNKKVKVMIRLNPGIDAHTHSYIQTAKLNSKFGISIYNESDVAEFINKIKSSKYLEFMGVHFHIGSQIFDEKAHVKAAKVVIEFMRKLKENHQIEIKWLNVGGGFGISIAEDDKPYNISDVLKLLIRKVEMFLKNASLKIDKLTIEPGRCIVSESAVTLYSVGGIKDTGNGRKYVFIDGGMSDNIRPALYQAKYACDIVDNFKSKSETYSVAGKNCESGDILITDTALPVAKVGDLLMVYSTGAYCYSMASNYNRNTRPAVVFIKNKTASLVVKRESYDNLLINDVDLEGN